MYRRGSLAAALVLGLLAPAQALAQVEEIARIRREMREISEAYERRLQALEKRLAEAETRAAVHPRALEKPAEAMPPRAAENASNPAIELVLQGTFAKASQDADRARITGFLPGAQLPTGLKPGFRLSDSDLKFAANIDPYLRGLAVLSLGPDGGLQVEEANFQRIALPEGLKFKAGRFWSAIGYQNQFHQHDWDFQDAPLPYKAFLGQQLRQDGLQLTWVARSGLPIEIGAEFASGNQFPGTERSRSGAGSAAVMARLFGDGDRRWRAGITHLRTTASERGYVDSDASGNAVANSFSGAVRLWVADALLRWPLAWGAGVTLQGEYFRASHEGALSYDDTGQTVPRFGRVLTGRFSARQAGWYLQGVWQFLPKWRVGYRYDALRYGAVSNALVAAATGLRAADFPALAAHNPTRDTVMLDYSPSPSSRFRMQLGSDRSWAVASNTQVLFQYIHSIGATDAP